jgi:hypothetical protein
MMHRIGQLAAAISVSRALHLETSTDEEYVC